MKHREVFSGFLAEFRVPVDVQHRHIEVRDGQSTLEIPGEDELLIGEHQFPPQPAVGYRGNAGEKAPMEALDEFKNLKNNRMSSGIHLDGSYNFHQGGKGLYFVAYHPVIQKGKQLMV
jgi:hypothetical protein